MREQDATSLEYQAWQVTFRRNGVLADPTGDVVQFAFTTSDLAPSVGWVNGVWEKPAPNVYNAAVLVGPNGAFAPNRGVTYYVWIKITDNPEIPVRNIDTLTAT